MIYSLSFLKGGYIGMVYGSITGDIKGDATSLSYSSHEFLSTDLPKIKAVSNLNHAVQSTTRS